MLTGGGIAMRPVLVVWEDASMEAGGPWVQRLEMKPMEPRIFQQMGFLVEESETCVVLTHALERDDDKGLMAPRERIPRGMVRSITDLAPAAPKKGRAR